MRASHVDDTAGPAPARPSRFDRFPPAVGNVLLLLASVSIALIGAEMVFRFVEPTSPPGTTYGRPVHKNAHDFRDREFAIPKPPGLYRVLVLGDSFAWGVGLDLEQTISKRLEEALADTHDAASVEVVNAAIPGTNTVDQLLLLEDRGWLYEPDLVVLVYNLNDIDFKPHLAPRSYEGQEATPVVQIDPGDDVTIWSKNRGLRGLILEVEYRSALARFLVPRGGQLLQRAGLLNSAEFSWVAKVFGGFHDGNPGWLESKRALRAIAEGCRRRGIPLVMGIYPLLVGLDDYGGRAAHAAVAGYAASVGVDNVVDLLPVFEGKNGRSFWINYADGHPNAEAHQLVANALLPALRHHVSGRRARKN